MTTDAPIEGTQGAPGLRLIAECSTRPLTHDDLALVGGFEAEDEPDTPEPTAAADTEGKTVLWQDEPTGGPDDTSEDEPPASVHAPAGASIFDLPRMAGRVVLASGSPRRVELLREIGFEPVVAPQDVDETPQAHEDPVELVRRLARLKAHSACDRNDATPGDLVIAADTTVWFEGTDLGKPSEAADACLFDLGFGNPHIRPTAENGAEACRVALDDAPTPLPRGNVGAGTGCTVGKLGGPKLVMKSGLGTDVEQAGPLACGAVAAVNACGNVYDPDTGEPIAGMRSHDGAGLVDECELAIGMAARMPLGNGTPRAPRSGSESPSPRTNTTISCVVTNARLTKAQATKVAQMAADAYAHAIRPTHTTNDGDTVFVMATGEIEMPVDVVGILATRALERAIADGARSAKTLHGVPGAASL